MTNPIDYNLRDRIELPDDFTTEYPILDLQGKVGYSEYIDFLRSSDLSYPIMVGIDALCRPFVTFRIQNGEHIQALVIFQRYTSNTYCYTNSGFLSDRSMRTDSWQMVNDLILHGKSTYGDKEITLI